MAVAVEVEHTPLVRGRGTPTTAVRAPDGPYARARGRAEALDHTARIEAAFRRHYDTLVQICRERTADPSRAEDLAQETLVRALRYGHSFDPSKPVLPWLRTIATRVVIDDAARAANQREHVSDLHADHDLVADDVVDEEALAAVAGDPQLRQAFGSLTPPQQIAMRLRYVEDWSGGDTANFLGISRAACDQVVARAKRSMRKQLEGIREGYPVLLPAPVARLVTRFRVWAAQRRAGANLDLGVAPSAALAEAVAVAVAVAVSLAGTAVMGSDSAAADEAPTAVRHSMLTGVLDDALSSRADVTSLVAADTALHTRGQAAAGADPAEAAAVGSSRTYQIDPPTQAALDGAPPTHAEAGVAEDPTVARVDAEVTVTAAGYEIPVVDVHLTVQCEGVTSGAACEAVRRAVDELPGDEQSPGHTADGPDRTGGDGGRDGSATATGSRR